MPKIDRRQVTLRYKDGTKRVLWLTACTVIHTDMKSVALHLDMLKDDDYRLIVNRELLPDDKRIAAIEFD